MSHEVLGYTGAHSPNWEASEATLHEAKRTLDAMTVVGITERMDETMVLFSEEWRLPLAAIQSAYTSLLQASTRAKSIRPRADPGRFPPPPPAPIPHPESLPASSLPPSKPCRVTCAHDSHTLLRAEPDQATGQREHACRDRRAPGCQARDDAVSARAAPLREGSARRAADGGEARLPAQRRLRLVWPPQGGVRAPRRGWRRVADGSCRGGNQKGKLV